MRISIWFQFTEGPWGGGNQFLRTLADQFEKMGHRVSQQPLPDADIALLNSHNAGPGELLYPGQVAEYRQTGRISGIGRFISPVLWLRMQRRGPKIVHRLDGVAKLIRGFKSQADVITPQINRLTDHTIFQSIYSQTSFSKYAVNPAQSTLIYNGVDTALFYPRSDPKPLEFPLKLAAVSWSDNLRKGFLGLAELSKLPDIEVHFIGRWPKALDPANVILCGTATSQEISVRLREMHAMVHLAENEPCSNAILEALASGLPVLYRDSGGNRELASEFGVAMTGDFGRDIALFRDQYSKLQEKVREAHSCFSIKTVAEKYMEVFEKALGGIHD